MEEPRLRAPMEPEPNRVLGSETGDALCAGRYDFGRRAIALNEQLRVDRSRQDRPNEVRTLVALSSTLRNVADYSGALDYLYAALDIGDRLNDASLKREVSLELMIVNMELGDFAGALGYAREEADSALHTDDAERKLLALNTLGCVLMNLGEHAAGVQKLREAMSYLPRIADARRREHLLAQSHADLAEAYLLWNKPREALEHAQHGLHSARSIQHSPIVMLNALYAGRAALALGDTPSAEASSYLAVELAATMGLKSHQVQAHLVLADVLARQGRFEEALESYRSGHRLERDIRRDEAVRRQEYQRARKAIDDANRERESAERVLFTVLPRPLAQRMKDGEARIAEEVRDASVLFADLVNFTAMTTRVNVRELLTLLDEIFSEFDALTARFQLEKIKTIGDSYMVAGGALSVAPDHLDNCVRLGFGMLDTMERINAARATDLSVRIGLHVGPAISGVIGTQRLSYDLWGGTVNLASRLEASGVPGRIHVSAAVAQRLAERFDFEPRGMIDLKGFERMPTFFIRR